MAVAVEGAKSLPCLLRRGKWEREVGLEVARERWRERLLESVLAREVGLEEEEEEVEVRPLGLGSGRLGSGRLGLRLLLGGLGGR